MISDAQAPRHLTETSQLLCGTAQELQPLTKLSSIQNCPVMCFSNLSYNGSKVGNMSVKPLRTWTGPSSCFPFMNTEYPQIQVLVGILSFISLKSSVYLLFILRVDIEPTVKCCLSCTWRIWNILPLPWTIFKKCGEWVEEPQELHLCVVFKIYKWGGA